MPIATPPNIRNTLYIYQKAFNNFDMGVAASASLVLFVIILAVTLIQLKLFDTRLDY